VEFARCGGEVSGAEPFDVAAGGESALRRALCPELNQQRVIGQRFGQAPEPAIERGVAVGMNRDRELASNAKQQL
jgi:hypothetical protein